MCGVADSGTRTRKAHNLGGKRNWQYYAGCHSKKVGY